MIMKQDAEYYLPALHSSQDSRDKSSIAMSPESEAPKYTIISNYKSVSGHCLGISEYAFITNGSHKQRNQSYFT